MHVKLYATTGYVRLLERGVRSPHRSRAPISADHSLTNRRPPSSRQEGSTALKKHIFTVPHDGAKVVARRAINEGCLEAFMLTFIGGDGATIQLFKSRGLDSVSL